MRTVFLCTYIEGSGIYTLCVCTVRVAAYSSGTHQKGKHVQYFCTHTYTVGSHLSELQLYEHVGYPNAFSKATPTISGYFCRVSGLAVPVVWQLKRHRITSTGKAGFATKVKVTTGYC